MATQPLARRAQRALTICSAAALVAILLPLAALGAGGPDPAVAAAATSEDFASVAYGDAWDFSNTLDARLSPDRVSPLTANPRMESDELRFSARGGPSLITFVFPGYGGALYMERDGGALPVDADRYTHLAMRIWSPTQRAMSFSYDRCLAPEHSDKFCRESTDNVILERGWNTVVRDLRQMSANRAYSWEGLVYAFRMMNDVGEHYRVEYVRLQTAPQTVEVPWDARPGADLYWDRDATTANNTADASGWGVVPTSGGRGQFPAGAMEPGEYRFYVRQASGAVSAYGEPLRVSARPAPFVLDPDLAGGEDFATVANGDPWDFATPSDVIAMGGFTDASFGPGGLRGTNNSNDPFFYLRMAHPLNADRYHRLTVHATYEGAFGLADAPGGGAHARLMWTRADRDQAHVIQGNKLIESREMVHYPGQVAFTVDLKTPPDPAFVMETDRVERDGWSTGSPITHIRYDVNEDRGARRWRVARIELRADDETSAEAYTIRWRDAAHNANSVVSLFYRPAGGGPERLIESGIRQQPGENRYVWDTGAVTPGSYLVRVAVDDGVGQGSHTSTGPVAVRSSIRVAGPDRVSTSVALSKAAFRLGAPAAVLARAGTFPDALAAAPLAAAARGPLLLSSSDRLDQVVRDELERLGVETIFLLGGENALNSQVEAQAKATGAEVVRVAGPDRYRTAGAAARVAVNLWQQAGEPSGQDVLIALGTDFPDALAAGTLAGHLRRPLLLTGRDELPAGTLATLDSLNARTATVVGGSAAVSDAVVAHLRSKGITVRRIAGKSRHETAELAAREAVAAGAKDKLVLVASGRAFADALAAGPAAVQLDAVLLLTERDVLPPATRAWVAGRKPLGLLRLAGGAAAVSNAVEQELIALGR